MRLCKKGRFQRSQTIKTNKEGRALNVEELYKKKCGSQGLIDVKGKKAQAELILTYVHLFNSL